MGKHIPESSVGRKPLGIQRDPVSEEFTPSLFLGREMLATLRQTLAAIPASGANTPREQELVRPPVRGHRPGQERTTQTPSERVCINLLPAFDEAERAEQAEQVEAQRLLADVNQRIANFPTATDSSSSSNPGVVQSGFFSESTVSSSALQLSSSSESNSDSETPSDPDSPSI